MEIKTRNLIDNPKKTDVIGLAYVPTITIPPRTVDPPYVPPKVKKDKRIWSFPISIFKDWRRDDEVIPIIIIAIRYFMNPIGTFERML